MNTSNIKSYIANYKVDELIGTEKFLLVVGFLSKRSETKEISISEVKSIWPKSILKLEFNSNYYHRAQVSGWVDPTEGKKGLLQLTYEGIEKINSLSKLIPYSNNTNSTNSLIIFEKKSTYSFDKFLRNTLQNAQQEIYIVDSYVDETLFDNILHVVTNKSISIKLIYGHVSSEKKPLFDNISSRYSKEYPFFKLKTSKDLHDRYIIVDNIAYILGPSIKDAAVNSNAIVVKLNHKDSILLKKFTDKYWNNLSDKNH